VLDEPSEINTDAARIESCWEVNSDGQMGAFDLYFSEKKKKKSRRIFFLCPPNLQTADLFPTTTKKSPQKEEKQ